MSGRAPDASKCPMCGCWGEHALSCRLRGVAGQPPEDQAVPRRSPPPGTFDHAAKALEHSENVNDPRARPHAAGQNAVAAALIYIGYRLDAINETLQGGAR